MKHALILAPALVVALGVLPVRANGQRPDNPHGTLTESCATCHRPDAWKPARVSESFRHAEKTFPLDGAHRQTACRACHKSLEFATASAACASCHSDIHHGELGTQCARCHTTRSFVDEANMRRAHETTRLPLRGAHATAPCEDCHVPAAHGQMQFANRPTTCVGCHADNYRLSKTPDHQAARFSQNCASCHGVATWSGARFDHSTTKFALDGAHRAVSCTGCHADKVYVGKQTACVSCHMADFTKSVTPPHASSSFPTTCATCHSTTAWKGATFDHSTTQFALTGAHMVGTCTACHADGVYKGKPTACVGCHQQSFAVAVLPPHQALGFSSVCSTCHTAAAWQPATYDHSVTPFPLTGAHKAASCNDCHADNVYQGKPTTCVSCHQADYNKTASPPHAASAFSTACATCHNTTAWAGTPFDHSATQFPLTGAHLATACTACHNDGVYKGKPTTCVSCHQPNYAAALLPPHQSLGFSTVCSSCHTTALWQPASYDHSATTFPLAGAHKAASCNNCHADNVYRGKSTACVSCHQQDLNIAVLPPHTTLGFSTVCSGCHTSAVWQPSTFDHATTIFPLTGAHRAGTCADCHADKVYVGKPTTCVSCHQATYAATKNPPHAASGIATACANCHSTTAWAGSPFDHSTTLFPLTGAHAAQACTACHADGVYKGKSTACVSCHQQNYTTALLPPHQSLAFPSVCSACHTTAVWQPASYDHSTTLFPLTGAHRAAGCNDCHADKVYLGKSVACVSCHQSTYAATKNPPHVASGFSTSCAGCHNTTAWAGSPFDHSATLFPLTGAHAAQACTACHADGVYKGKSTACVSCHQQSYTTALLPPHQSLGFSTVCSTCHTTAVWQPATFDHSATSFPLTGTHATQTCTACHADGVYKGKPTLCASCHQSDFNKSVNPPHVSSGFPTTCETCHGTTAWKGGSFNHAATLFPLTGFHTTATCTGCHADGVFKGKATTCISCHQQSYNTALLPPHQSLAFSTVCSTCHTTAVWQPASYDHSTTIFPLTGAHRAASCSDCHADKVYKGKPTTCVSCHLANYNASKSPPHAASSIGTTCEGCHTTTVWTGATYNHSTTPFPLTGAHTTVACSGCHSDGVYHGKTMVCSGCHLANYNATTNPVHSAAHFPTNCESCHNTTTWLGATFNHDASFFPIYSGSHKGKWSVCSSCHTSPTNYAVFTCTSCHSKSSADSDHKGKAGYVYDSAACYSCHPKGKAG